MVFLETSSTSRWAAKSIAAIEWAMSNNNAVFLTAQQDMDVEDPGFRDLYAYGVVAEVKQVLRVSDELVKVLVEGKYRAGLLTLDSSGRFLLASTGAAALRGTKSVDSARVEALVRSVKEAFEEYLSPNPRLPKTWCIPSSPMRMQHCCGLYPGKPAAEIYRQTGAAQ